MADLTICILAAGASTRMQENIKQLLPWRHTTLLGNAVEQALQVSTTVMVILGSEAVTIEKTLPDSVTVIRNEQWDQGLGSSIACGAKRLLDTQAKISGFMVMLADQPLIDASYLNELVRTFKQANTKIVATDYGKRLGVPAIFHSSILQELAQLNKDFGAKNIISKYQEQARGVSPNGKEIDVDTPESYQKCYKEFGQS